MKSYNNQHEYYCGIDLHARKMYACIISNKGKVRGIFTHKVKLGIYFMLKNKEAFNMERFFEK